jgi:hypothetical protein
MIDSNESFDIRNSKLKIIGLSRTRRCEYLTSMNNSNDVALICNTKALDSVNQDVYSAPEMTHDGYDISVDIYAFGKFMRMTMYVLHINILFNIYICRYIAVSNGCW